MTRRTEVEIGIRNPEATESFFDRLRRGFHDLKDGGKEAFSEVTKGAGDLLKTGVGAAIASQAMDIANSITQPMRTSFSGAIDAAKQYRTVVTEAAIGTGRSFGTTDASIRQSSRSIGESHQTVLSFSKSVQANTGYWLEGTKALDAYQDRAKFLGKTFGEMSSEAGQLSNLFDLRDGDRITMLFNTMNAQAEKLGVNAKVASMQFDQMAGSMARMTSAGPEKLAAISSAFLKAAGGNKEQASVIQQGVMNFIRTRLPYIEDEMRASGKIKKGESILGKDGRIREDLFVPIVKSQQAYIKHHFGRKEWREQMRILGQGDVFGSPEAAAGFLNLDTKGMEEASKIIAPPTQAFLKRHLTSKEGKRAISDENKFYKDVGLGSGLLDAQDKMAEYGGGSNGVIMDTAAKVGVGAVAIKVGQKVLEKVVQKGATTAATKAITNAAPGAATRAGFSTLGLLSRGLGPVGIVAGILMNPDKLNENEYAELENAKNEQRTWDTYLKQLPPEERKRREESHNAKGFFEFELRAFKDYESDHSNRWGRFWQSVAGVKEPTLSKEAEEKISKLLPEDMKELASEFGQDLINRTLKVTVVPTEPPKPPKSGETNHP